MRSVLWDVQGEEGCWLAAGVGAEGVDEVGADNAVVSERTAASGPPANEQDVGRMHLAPYVGA